MRRSITNHRSTPISGGRKRGLLMAITLAGSIAGSSIALAPVLAQDATVTPAGPTCRTVLRGETVPTLVDLAQFVPVSTLKGAPVSPAVATPSSASTPLAEAAAVATPVFATPVGGEFGSIDESLRSIAFGITNCTTQGDFATLSTMVTENYLRETFAGGANLNMEDVLGLAAITIVPPQELIAFDNVVETATGATAEVILSSGNQLLHQQWNFVDNGGTWMLDSDIGLPALAVQGSNISNVTISGNIKADPREVEGPNVVLIGENSEDVDHEMLVLRLPQGATTDLLLQEAGPNLPAGVGFIGQMTVPANSTATLALTDLPAGNYVIVCMLLDENGVPYLADGYRARLIVE